MTSAPKHPEDPGRDPEGLDPPRDVLDAATGMPEEGGFTPPRGDLDPIDESDVDESDVAQSQADG